MYDICLKTNVQQFENDLLDEIKLFYRYYKGEEISVNLFEDVAVRVEICVFGEEFSFLDDISTFDVLERKRLIKRFIKGNLYRVLSRHYCVNLPWGSLTGIRPTKLAYDFLKRGGKNVAEYLSKTFYVSDARANLIDKIIKIQSPYVQMLEDKYNLYVHVPFCNGRCSYCSFPSLDISKVSYPTNYVELLCHEIEELKFQAKQNGKNLLSVYVGGGTPSVLCEQDIYRLLRAIDARGVEFTFEVGRADSFSEEKARILKEGGVTRICINPQSLNDDTLDRIGRRHSVKDFYKAYDIAKKYNFKINTDIIAGLDGEDVSAFEKTVDGILALSPENATVHTLSRKRGSDLAFCDVENSDVEKMMEFAIDVFSKEYLPYYLYRQKYMVGNLENVGFAKIGNECVNNITVMEELLPVYACGAGSISKNIKNGVISRFASPKDVKMYIEEFEIRLDEKINYFSK